MHRIYICKWVQTPNNPWLWICYHHFQNENRLFYRLIFSCIDLFVKMSLPILTFSKTTYCLYNPCEVCYSHIHKVQSTRDRIVLASRYHAYYKILWSTFGNRWGILKGVEIENLLPKNSLPKLDLELFLNNFFLKNKKRQICFYC